MRGVITLLLLTIPTIIFCQTLSAVFHQTTTDLLYLDEASFQKIQSKNDSAATAGYELVDLEMKDGKYWGIWRKSGTGVSIEKFDDWSAFDAAKKEHIKTGKLLTDVEVFSTDEGTMYLGFWKEKRHAHNIWKLNNLKAVQFHYQEMAKLNLYLQDIEVVKLPDGSKEYFVLYHRGEPSELTHLTHFTTSAELEADKAKRSKSGYGVVDFEIDVTYDFPSYFVLYKRMEEESSLQYQLDEDGMGEYMSFLGTDHKIVDREFSEGTPRYFTAPYSLKRIQKTPDSDMASLAIATKSAAPKTKEYKNSSAAFAAANGLYWLAQNGFDRLVSGSKAQTAAELTAKELTKGNYMKMMVPSQSSTIDVINGLAQYIEDKKYPLDQIQYYDISDFNEGDLSESVQNVLQLEDELKTLPLAKAKESFSYKSIALIKWGMYKPSIDGKHLVKQSENWSTLVGYGMNEHGNEKDNILIINDPVDGEATRQKFMRVGLLEEYFMMTEKCQLQTPTDQWKDEAEDYSSISALERQMLSYSKGGERSSFPVWEGLLIVRVVE